MRTLLPAACCLLAACSSGPSNDTLSAEDNAIVNVDAIDSARDVGAPEASPAPMEAPAPGTPGGLANDTTPVSEAPFTATSAQGAADVVQRYYALIEAKKYGEAWALWEDGGKASGTTPEAFAASFGKYSEYHANIGAPGEIDAGAGQRYVTVPVVVYGRLAADGRRFDLKGNVTLHRTEVDGATREQRSWRIRSAELKPSPQ